MNGDRVRRTRLCISSLSAIVGLYAMFNARFSFSGSGESGFWGTGDSFFFSGIFRLNAFGGAVLIATGILGIVAVLQRARVLGWLATIVAAVAGIVVLVGVGDAKTIVGAGNAKNAALYFIAAVGIATTQWAATVASTKP